MAVTSPTSRPATRAYRRNALIWLLMTLILGVVTALVWMFAKTPAARATIENAPITASTNSAIDITKTTKIEALHELDADVQPIDFSAMVRDLREYPEEFKDKRYLLTNKGKWTVQVMNVAENDVIVDYLLGREDRSKFAYFRYRDDNDQLRYMLTYGIMSSAEEAMGASKLMDFGLPANVRVIPEEFNRYVNSIDNYELADPVVDLASNRNRQVRLQPTRREVPVRKRATAPTQDNSASNDSQSAAANNNSASNQAARASEEKRSIRSSEDASETLVVEEERIVNTGDNGVVTAPKNEGGSKNDTSVTPKSTDKKPAEAAPSTAKKDPAAKPDTSNKTGPKEGNNKDKSKNNTGNTGAESGDAIKALIEEKKP